MAAPKCVTVLRGHTSEVQAITFDSSELHLLTGDAEGELRVWNLVDCRPVTIQRLHPVNAGIISLRLYSIDGQTKLVSQARNGVILTWGFDDSTGKVARDPSVRIDTGDHTFCRCSVLVTTGAPVQAADAANRDNGSRTGDTERLGRDSAIPLDSSRAEQTSSPASSQQECQSPRREESRTGRRASRAWALMAGSDPAVAEVWDLVAGERLLTLRDGDSRLKEGGLCTAVVLFQNKLLPTHTICAAVGHEAGFTALWLIDIGGAKLSGKLLAVVKLHTEPITCLDVARDGTRGISGSAERTLVLFDVDILSSSIHIRQTGILGSEGVTDASIGQQVAVVAGWDGRACVLNLKTAKPIAKLGSRIPGVTSVCLTERGGLAALGAKDGSAAVWQLPWK